MSDDKGKFERSRLRSLLNAHGANPDRWPPAERHLQLLLTKDPLMKKLQDETRALDDLLELARYENRTDAGADAEQQNMNALRQHILADFHRLSSDDEPGELAGFAAIAATRGKEAVSPAKTGWFAAAALAAGFVLGIYLGGIGIGGWTLDPATSIASLSGTEVDRTTSGDFTDFATASGFEEYLL